MSRYKQVITGEKELTEINGTRFLIYPTIEARMELLEHIKSTQVIEEFDEKDEFGKVIGTRRIRGKYFNLPSIAKTCAKMAYEGCFEHDKDGKRIKKKDSEIETTENQIIAIILELDVMALYLEILQALDIIDKDKAEDLKEKQIAAAKK